MRPDSAAKLIADRGGSATMRFACRPPPRERAHAPANEEALADAHVRPPHDPAAPPVTTRRLVPNGDEVVVTYEAERTDGGRFRNTEVLTFAGGRLTRAEVYFGWNL